MKIKVKCRHCGKEFEVEICAEEGYIMFPSEGTAYKNILTDGSCTVDLFCSFACRDS